MNKEIIGYTTATTVLPKVDSGPDTNGHEYVDLGLPSGTLWATMDVGATSSTEYGNYYMYGMGTKTYDSADTPYDGTEDPLDLTKDTARQTWGGDWHTPTETLAQELIDNTTHEWVVDYNGSGVNGGLFTALNGNNVFIPAAGYCFTNDGARQIGDSNMRWTSSNGKYLSAGYNSGGYNPDIQTYHRILGIPVRPVIG